jgi:hypothetical protein
LNFEIDKRTYCGVRQKFCRWFSYTGFHYRCGPNYCLSFHVPSQLPFIHRGCNTRRYIIAQWRFVLKNDGVKDEVRESVSVPLQTGSVTLQGIVYYWKELQV